MRERARAKREMHKDGDIQTKKTMSKSKSLAYSSPPREVSISGSCRAIVAPFGFAPVLLRVVHPTLGADTSTAVLSNSLPVESSCRTHVDEQVGNGVWVAQQLSYVTCIPPGFF